MPRKRKLATKSTEQPQKQQRQENTEPVSTEQQQQNIEPVSIEKQQENTEPVSTEQQQQEENTEPVSTQQQQEQKQQEEEAQVVTESETQQNQDEEAKNEETEDNPDETQPLNPQSGDVEDDDDDPIEKLLEPLSKEQLVDILQQVAEGNPHVDEKIRKVADKDPVHRKVFVHGLGWDTTAEILTSEFNKYGEIEDVKNVVDKASGKCKGYAFVLFKTRKGAREALKEPQKKISNRLASCQLAVVGPSAPQQSVAAQQAVPESEHTKRKIYVTNVGAELDPQKLVEFFGKYGEIEDGPLGLDKVTGKPRGFCLFVYKTVDSAKKALEEPHKNFEGHMLHCQKAVDGPKLGKGKYQQQFQPQQNVKNNQFQRKKNQGFAGGSGMAQGHLMAPSGAGMGYNQGPAAAQGFNPALGHALTALLSNPAGNMGLTNLLGTLGPGIPGAPPPMQASYGNQGMHGGYGNQPMGPGSAGRGQHGAGHYGGGR